MSKRFLPLYFGFSSFAASFLSGKAVSDSDRRFPYIGLKLDKPNKYLLAANLRVGNEKSKA